jgi:hypothetical protein
MSNFYIVDNVEKVVLQLILANIFIMFILGVQVYFLFFMYKTHVF